MDQVQDTIRRFIASRCLPGEPPDDLRDDTPLQTSGILDSLNLMHLVAFIQERYGVRLDVYDTTVERFDRIADIARLIADRQPASNGAPEAAR